MRSACLPRRVAGTTLTEVLVTLTIVGVTIGVCLPLARSLGASAQLFSVSNGLLSDLHFARSEAIKRGTPVVVCKSTGGAVCSGEQGWEQGWIVFGDSNRNGLRDEGEPILQRLQTLPSEYRITGNQSVGRSISYHPSGMTRTAAGAFQAGTLTLCHASAQPVEARQIIINAAGRPRMHKLTLPSCN